MKRFIILSVSAAIGLFTLLSCQKEDDVNPGDNQSGHSYKFSDGLGVLAAVQTVSYVEVMGQLIPTYVNTASAAFLQSTGSATFVDAGTVKVTGKSLKQYANKAYAYENLLDPLSFDGGIQWQVGGAGQVPAFTHPVARPMPSFSGYQNLPATINRSTDFTVQLQGRVTNADSVLVQVISTNGNAMVIVAGNSANATLSASKLGSLSASNNAMVMVAPMNFSSQTFDGKKIYFVNEFAATKTAVKLE